MNLRLLGCLAFLVLLFFGAVAPVLVGALLGFDPIDLIAGPGLIVYFGVVAFGILAYTAITSGRLITRGRSLKREDHPVIFAIGAAVYAACALACYVAYIFALFAL